ncbi:DNA cytosine methyltransferase [Geothrix sp. PMB-07]|uniref:DNA cytosine methyltransferase n=1 Tax=Geothrix sp. PMB-07 TaxID=3068640 RepID=UPI002740CC04|nr:DNA cytosine methyltransferase [Geothrix sp. PMB-07]WLT31838.1 DNA cytosine methyltransferase [Geothrix sp. PMB-07]
MPHLSSLEICAGAGGQALGLDMAGFEHDALVEIDRDACSTLRLNRPHWKVFQQDLREFSGGDHKGLDLLAGGVPCPPFSVASKQLGESDERNLFPEAIRLVDETRPRAVMLENVRGLLDAVFEDYRKHIAQQLGALGYVTDWRLLNASDFGVPQLRPRVVFVAIQRHLSEHFEWPMPLLVPPPTVGETLADLMASGGWKGASHWALRADGIAPTLVGGSKKHGGPDLGPTRSRKAWESLCVDGKGLADEPPPPDFLGMPRLTVRMAARIQGFPDDWRLVGGKTSSYRQVGNAFPPPVAKAVGERIAACFQAASRRQVVVAGL